MNQLYNTAISKTRKAFIGSCGLISGLLFDTQRFLKWVSIFVVEVFVENGRNLFVK